MSDGSLLYMGKPLTELSREELIKALGFAMREMAYLRSEEKRLLRLLVDLTRQAK